MVLDYVWLCVAVNTTTLYRVAVGGATFFSLFASMLSRCAPREHRAFALGLAESTHGVAGVIGPVASGWLFENISSSAPAIAAGLLCMLAAPVAMALPLSVIAASDLSDRTSTDRLKPKQQ